MEFWYWFKAKEALRSGANLVVVIILEAVFSVFSSALGSGPIPRKKMKRCKRRNIMSKNLPMSLWCMHIVHRRSRSIQCGITYAVTRYSLCTQLNFTSKRINDRSGAGESWTTKTEKKWYMLYMTVYFTDSRWALGACTMASRCRLCLFRFKECVCVSHSLSISSVQVYYE